MAEDKGYIEGSRVPNSVPLPADRAPEPVTDEAGSKKAPKKTPKKK